MQFNYEDTNTGARYVLREVRPDDHVILTQMVGNDRVHDFGAQDLESLLKYRVGGKGCAKTAFALLAGNGSELRSVIYGYKTSQTISTPADIPGNVDVILKHPSRAAFEQAPTAMVFYSISSLIRGFGQPLINALLEKVDGFVPATLSPMRSLRASFSELAGTTLNERQKIALSYLHLLDAGTERPCNDVQAFHMGNGARIGDINVDANTPDSVDGVDGLGVMINYVYPTSQVERANNRATFKAIVKGGKRPEDVIDLMDVTLRHRLANLEPEIALLARQTGRHAYLSRLTA